MISDVQNMEWHAKTVRSWQLAILRFAVTRDNADRLAVLMLASEIDRLDPRQANSADFRFFGRTSAQLCDAVLRPSEHAAAILHQYLSRIEDDRLKRVFAAAIDEQPIAAPISKPIKRGNGLWKGLSSRGAY